MKKKIIYTLLLLLLLTGCADNNKSELNKDNNQDVKEENNDKPIEYTKFTALDKVYEENKNIMDLNEGDKIYDRMNDYPHVYGEYKEIDFASDLLTEYLHKNPKVYNYIVSEWNEDSDEVKLITGEDKERIEENVNFLGEQFGLSNEDPVYFQLDKVILQNKNENDNIVELELRGYLSATDGNYRPLGTFTVIVYTKGDKLYGSII